MSGGNFERLSGDYVRGYTMAIMDTQQVFRSIGPEMKAQKKQFSHKNAMELLDCILANREKVRERRRGFIRYNALKKGFEFYEGREAHEQGRAQEAGEESRKEGADVQPDAADG